VETETSKHLDVEDMLLNGRVRSLPAVGSPREDAGDAARRTPRRGGDLAGGRGWAGTGPQLS
jgi:hypothetical protein